MGKKSMTITGTLDDSDYERFERLHSEELKLRSLFSERAKHMKASEIRELLKLTQIPNIISFAGGLPNPDAFPVDDLAEIASDLIKNNGKAVLQYGSTEGSVSLREQLCERLAKEGIEGGLENIMITSGSQQGLDIMAKLFLNLRDRIIVGAPTYLGGTGAFNSYRGWMEMVPLDNNGLRIDLLEERLEQMKRYDISPKFIYVVPTFQNPAGVTMPEKRRRRLVDIAIENDLLILEDDPYGDLRYSGTHQRPIKAFDDEGVVIYLGTFSKILAPGFRVAWAVGSETIIRKFVIAKQSIDLCSSTLGQHIASEFMRRGLLDPHIEKIKIMYKRKRNLMLNAMDKYMPKEAEWTKPDGGLFLWTTLPEYIESKELLMSAVNKKVAFVVGTAFFPDRSGQNTMRLNFSHPADDKIEEGVKRLAEVIEARLRVPELEEEIITGV